jgi:hypothetical protein
MKAWLVFHSKDVPISVLPDCIIRDRFPSLLLLVPLSLLRSLLLNLRAHAILKTTSLTDDF